MNGLKLVASASTAVIVPGFTAPSVAEVFDWQHRSFVLVTFVSGSVGSGDIVSPL